MENFFNVEEMWCDFTVKTVYNECQDVKIGLLMANLKHMIRFTNNFNRRDSINIKKILEAIIQCRLYSRVKMKDIYLITRVNIKS